MRLLVNVQMFGMCKGCIAHGRSEYESSLFCFGALVLVCRVYSASGKRPWAIDVQVMELTPHAAPKMQSAKVRVSCMAGGFARSCAGGNGFCFSLALAHQSSHWLSCFYPG